MSNNIETILPEPSEQARSIVDSLIGILPADLDVEAAFEERWRKMSAYEPSDIEAYHTQQKRPKAKESGFAVLKRTGKFPVADALAGVGRSL